MFDKISNCEKTLCAPRELYIRSHKSQVSISGLIILIVIITSKSIFDRLTVSHFQDLLSDKRDDHVFYVFLPAAHTQFTQGYVLVCGLQFIVEGFWRFLSPKYDNYFVECEMALAFRNGIKL